MSKLNEGTRPVSNPTPKDALCAVVGGKLSALVDGELSELERLGVERHLEACAACQQELDDFRLLSATLKQQGRKIPQPPAWQAVAATVDARSRPAGVLRAWLRADFAIAASLGAIAILGLVAGLLLRGQVPELAEGRDTGLAQVEMLSAGLPGLDAFLASRRAVEVPPQKLPENVGFDPQILEELPGGFQLAKTYVVRDPCCTGSCLIYRRGPDVVSLVQQPASHPIRWGFEALESCTIAGRFCRRGSDRQVELVQIDPDGQNLTIVAKAGVIDTAAFVRALTSE